MRDLLRVAKTVKFTGNKYLIWERLAGGTSPVIIAEDIYPREIGILRKFRALLLTQKRGDLSGEKTGHHRASMTARAKKGKGKAKGV